jgi:flagellar basal body-associated protein FliL
LKGRINEFGLNDDIKWNDKVFTKLMLMLLIIIIIMIIIIIILIQTGFYPVPVILKYDTTQKNIYISQNITPRSNKTQHANYTNNKAHITYNEYKK